ncbi:MAG: hypothetical protein EOP04_29480 [Proteobacteria bacterium]|nr:MAG: hypothetical protein EOP04_29480 [Pseudomonadota bacterium]
MQIHLFDSPPIDSPVEGTKIQIAIGFDENLIDMGTFATRPVSLKGPPSIATIEAGVLDCFPSIRVPKKKSWKPTTLSNVIKEIARNHGLRTSIDASCESIPFPHEDQTESDAAFLARIAEHYECVFKIQGDCLIFYDRDSKITPIGTPIKAQRIENIIDYDFKYCEEPVYTGVKASWWDKKTAKEKSFIAGVEGKIHAIKFLMKDEQSAKTAALSKFKKLKRLTSLLSFTIPGNPLLFAGGRCLIETLHPLINGEWIIKSLEHVIDSNGFLTKVSTEGKAFA